ncbi:hypothetical protein Micbo1qcDRAFT_215815 [Microdochium bolleyi]|uniref:Uncharacterized protein n=1 Tax=Microdochium bolleyi TaxID=196109 RepID=A0A136IR86_9PEZI|nr:hypothetical protein Micbo1qcDRAFT_215815 [Microdochium bolleyi]
MGSDGPWAHRGRQDKGPRTSTALGYNGAFLFARDEAQAAQRHVDRSSHSSRTPRMLRKDGVLKRRKKPWRQQALTRDGQGASHASPSTQSADDATWGADPGPLSTHRSGPARGSPSPDVAPPHRRSAATASAFVSIESRRGDTEAEAALTQCRHGMIITKIPSAQQGDGEGPTVEEEEELKGIDEYCNRVLRRRIRLFIRRAGVVEEKLDWISILITPDAR